MKALEDSLVEYMDRMTKAKKEGVRKKAHIAFRKRIEEMVTERGEAAFTHPFDRLKEKMAILGSEDGKFRFFNWNFPHKDMSHDYFLYLLIRKEDGTLKKKKLKAHSTDRVAAATTRKYGEQGKRKAKKRPDKKDPQNGRSSKFSQLDPGGGETKKREEKPPERPLEFKTLSADEWPGALYYRVIPFHSSLSGEKRYILLGWDGHDKLTTKKMIEVLSFGKGGRIQFGAPIFASPGRTKSRVLFEYTSKATMSLKYQEDNDRLVFDHLSPKSPNLKGIYEYYGPDLSYDAYYAKDGMWRYEADVEAKMMNTTQKKWNDPNEDD